MSEIEPASRIISFLMDTWNPMVEEQEARLKKGADMLQKGQLTSAQKEGYAKLQDVTTQMSSAGKDMMLLVHSLEMVGYTAQEMLAEVPWCQDAIKGNYRDLTAEEKPLLTKFLNRLQGYCEELRKKDLEV